MDNPKPDLQSLSLRAAEREVIDAALADVGPRCPYVRLKAAVLTLLSVRAASAKET